MDTQNDNRSCDQSSVFGLDGHRAVVGIKQLKKALLAGNARQVFLARDADPTITEPMEALCQAAHVECVWVDTMRALGKACGIEVGAAAAAAVN